MILIVFGMRYIFKIYLVLITNIHDTNKYNTYQFNIGKSGSYCEGIYVNNK